MSDLTFVCDVCGKPVAIKDGIIECSHAPGSDKETWKLGHLECLKENSESYWFGLDRCNTPAAALQWTTHLSEKPWLDLHDWVRLLKIHFVYRDGYKSPPDPVGKKPMN